MELLKKYDRNHNELKIKIKIILNKIIYLLFDIKLRELRLNQILKLKYLKIISLKFWLKLLNKIKLIINKYKKILIKNIILIM